MNVKPMHSIYHQEGKNKTGKTIRLNLRACKQLLGRHLDNFDEISGRDRIELQKRLLIYVRYGKLAINSGYYSRYVPGSEDREPSIEHLPDADALEQMRNEINNKNESL